MGCTEPLYRTFQAASEQRPGYEPGLERMGFMILHRTFHNAPEQRQDLNQGREEWVAIPIFRS